MKSALAARSASRGADSGVRFRYGLWPNSTAWKRISEAKSTSFEKSSRVVKMSQVAAAVRRIMNPSEEASTSDEEDR